MTDSPWRRANARLSICAPDRGSVGQRLRARFTTVCKEKEMGAKAIQAKLEELTQLNKRIDKLIVAAKDAAEAMKGLKDQEKKLKLMMDTLEGHRVAAKHKLQKLKTDTGGDVVLDK